MPARQRFSRLQRFRKMLKVFGFAQTFLTILLLHLSVVLGIYILLASRSHPASGHFIQAVGVVVIVCGLIASFFWRFIAKLATEGMLILADLADGVLQMRKDGLMGQSSGVRQKTQEYAKSLLPE